MRRLLRIIQRKGWLCRDVGMEHHEYPNHDRMRHEAVDCPCGPEQRMSRDEDGESIWVVSHWSLDAREAER